MTDSNNKTFMIPVGRLNEWILVNKLETVRDSMGLLIIESKRKTQALTCFYIDVCVQAEEKM